MRQMHRSVLKAVPLALAALGMAALTHTAVAASSHGHERMSRSDRDDAQDAQQRVNAAVKVVSEMKQDPGLARLLDQAKGVFVIPRFGSGALIVGGHGGGGVVLAHREGKWSDPAFFDVGGASIGAQAGGAGGSVALLLMTQKALDKFETTNGRWALNAGAGLTLANYNGSARAQGNHDVIVWTNAKGLYGGLTASATYVTPVSDMNHAYYEKEATPREILTGSASNAGADTLRDTLLTRVASK